MSQTQLTIKEALKIIIQALLRKGLRVIRNPITNTIDIYNKISSDRIGVILQNGVIRVSTGRYMAGEVDALKKRYEEVLTRKNISLPL